jgi:dipeptidyl aminopeptidase/acylaminoacyl peptidase
MRSRSPLLTAAIFLLLACQEAPPPVVPPPPAPPPAEPVTAALAPPSPPAPPPPRADATLLPRKLLFGNPERLPPHLSPDGKRLLFVAPDQGVLNLWVAPADDPRAARVITHERTRPISQTTWAATGKHVLYSNDKGGDENYHVFVVDVETGQERDLTPFDGVRSDLRETFEKHPGTIFVTMNRRDRRYRDPVLIDILTGKIEVLAENTEGYSQFFVDQDLKLRLAAKSLPDGNREVFALPKGAPPKSIAHIPFEDAETTQLQGFDRTGKTLYLRDSRGHDTRALVGLDVASGQTRVLFEDPKSDLEAVHYESRSLRPVMVATNRERRVWHALDAGVAADLAALGKVSDGDLEMLGASRDDQRWVVGYLQDDAPMSIYLWDRKAKKATFLYTLRPALSGKKLARMHPVTIPSRDGLELVSYLTTPPSADADQDGKPDGGPLPMVLSVHGGPWGRDTWGFDPVHQWLASRGYAVLSVNYRGSFGFGKRFLGAGDREWGGKMHDDLVDAVRWAVDQKIADPKKVAILGGSYGGYATLVGLSFTPDVFACGVDIVGPSNLVTLLETFPAYWAPALERWVRRIGGDHRTPAGRRFLFERSPLSRVADIKRPLLIGQGANDPRVKQAESDQIVRAMAQKGLPVTYVLYPDEGHGFDRPENELSFNAVAEIFLAQHLGGSYEPIGSDFAGASLTVPSGADQVYGLSAALPKKP